MPLWNLGMSLGQFLMAGSWLLCADLPGRLRKAIHSPFLWLVTGLFFLHLLGLWNTEDFTYAMKDIRVKLPLLLMPLMFAAGPELTAKEYRYVFYGLLTGVLISTGYGFAMAAGWTEQTAKDYRDYSHFISHIRLGLLIDFCIVWLVLHRATDPLPGRWLITAIWLAWMTLFLLLIQSITGLLILTITGLVLLILLAMKNKQPAIRWMAAGVLLLAMAAGGWMYKYIFVDAIHYVDYQPYPSSHKTSRGGTYTCDFARQDLESGRLVWENYCDTEMDTAWQARTGKSIWENNAHHQMYLVILIRYLTNAGHTKDYEGVMALTDTDIRNILNGKTSPFVQSRNTNPLQRLDDLALEYRIWYYSGWANGQSMVQRFEYLKAGKYILSQHLLSGVGTGDLPHAYDQAYRELNSSLKPEWRLRAHNQYLSFGIAFGLPGMFYLFFVLIWLMRTAWKTKHHLLVAFLLIAGISFLSEDTLETQAGVTFFAFILGWLWRYGNGHPTPDSLPR